MLPLLIFGYSNITAIERIIWFCSAILLTQAVIVKTVMVDWRLEEDNP